MSIEDFKKQYNVTTMQENCRKSDYNLTCPYCNKQFKLHNTLSIHIKFNHKEEWEKIKQDKENKKNKQKESHQLECKLCGIKTNLLYYHINCSHRDITWDNYCEQFNHDKNLKSFFTDEHKKMLSINKKQFYDSDRGLKERERLSKKYSGKNNPACLPEVRKKISDAALKKMIDSPNNNFVLNSYGIKFNFKYNGQTYYTRSFEEFKVIYTLLKNNIKFEYEKIFLKYKLNETMHTYILDLKINDMYIEIKSDTTKCNYYDLPKYKSIEAMLNSINKHLYILTYKEICEKLKIKPIQNIYLYQDIKMMLDKDECFISKYISSKKQKNSRILMAIDKDYKNNKNIKIFGDKNEND
jgi:hypothetical protein